MMQPRWLRLPIHAETLIATRRDTVWVVVAEPICITKHDMYDGNHFSSNSYHDVSNLMYNSVPTLCNIQELQSLMLPCVA